MTKGLQATTFLQNQRAHQLQRLIRTVLQKASQEIKFFLASPVVEVKK
jgi:hypothetical protein